MLEIIKITEAMKDGQYGARIEEAQAVQGDTKIRVVMTPFSPLDGTEYEEIMDWIDCKGSPYSKAAYFQKAFPNVDELKDLRGELVGITVKVNETAHRIYYNVTHYREYDGPDFTPVVEEDPALPFN